MIKLIKWKFIYEKKKKINNNYNENSTVVFCCFYKMIKINKENIKAYFYLSKNNNKTEASVAISEITTSESAELQNRTKKSHFNIQKF